MKNIALLFLTMLLSSLAINAQSFNAGEYLDINRVKARYLVHGNMFWNPTTQQPAYEFPKGSGKHSNFTSGLWIGGVDQATNNLKVAAQTFGTQNDFWPGPLDPNIGGTIDSATMVKWAQIWKVNRTSIDSFKQLSTHTISNTPKSILEWPGRQNQYSKTPTGDTLLIPNRPMAPFVDVNNDNIYNPLDGDYPDIRGEQMLWWLFNDVGNTKMQSGSPTMNLEVQASAYGCNQPGLENTTFLDYRIYNWGTSIIDSTYISIFSEADLGNGWDDFLGYDTFQNMGVVYNGDNFDDNVSGYGSSLTQTGIVMPRGPRGINPAFPGPGQQQYLELKPSSFTHFDNSSGPTGDPTILNEYYNYMTGSWKDGSPFLDGCDPYNSGSPFPYIYPDVPSMVGGISEVQCNITPGDRRYVFSSGPFQLYPGIVPSDITFAFINTDTGVDNSNFNELRRLADSAYKYVNGCGAPTAPAAVNQIMASNFKIYPNPTDGYFIIQDEKKKHKQISLFNAFGQVVFKDESNKFKTEIAVNNFAQGLYFLHIRTNEGVYTSSIQVE